MLLSATRRVLRTGMLLPVNPYDSTILVQRDAPWERPWPWRRRPAASDVLLL